MEPVLSPFVAVLAALASWVGVGGAAATGAAPAPASDAEAIPAGPADGTESAVAKPADDVAHPGSRTEWWYAHAMDPRTGRTIIVTFFTDPLPATGGFWFDGAGGKTRWTGLSLPQEHEGPGVSLRAGGIRYDAAAKAWEVEQEASGYTVRLRFTDTVPGVTAGPVTYGDEDMWWSAPVATGRADGEVILPSGERVEVRGWRAYHDHNWGRFDLQSDGYRGWEWAVVHEPGDRAALLGGLTGADGRFRGVLVRATPDGTTHCRPSLVLAGWTVSDGHRFPQEVTARCPDARPVRFTVTEPYVVRLTTHGLTESIGRTDAKGSLGLVEHLAALVEP